MVAASVEPASVDVADESPWMTHWMTQEAFKGAVAESAGVPKDNVLITGERMPPVYRCRLMHTARGACTLHQRLLDYSRCSLSLPGAFLSEHV